MAEKKIRVLVFPCGSEIGLEVHRSLKYARHVELIGASSVEDHGRFVYEKYFGEIPFIDSPDFDTLFLDLVKNEKIDAIYPTMDAVITKLDQLVLPSSCKVIGSSIEANLLALSKRNTYEFFEGKIRIPKLYHSIEAIESYPVFCKPNIGYGSRGAKLLKNKSEVEKKWEKGDDLVFMEYLPGEEFTVDCFTDQHGQLLFSAPRKRHRIQKGISVNTVPAPEIAEETRQIAEIINQHIKLRGAWFFQVKKDKNGELALLEFATRLGGSSALYRIKGVNFALMSVFDAFDFPVSILENQFCVELDRALDQKFRMSLSFNTVYVDLDDCLLLDGRVNPSLMAFIFQSLNQKKKLVLITKHEKDLSETLRIHRLEGIFDELIHLSKSEFKADYIIDEDSIFIDDSFAERKHVADQLGIPVFAPDAVAALITDC